MTSKMYMFHELGQIRGQKRKTRESEQLTRDTSSDNYGLPSIVAYAKMMSA